MDLYEELVQFYLTVIEGCAVTPQVPILPVIDGKVWAAYPDFLALDFKKELIQIVEVTKATNRAAGPKLAEKLNPDYREKVEKYIRGVTLNNHLREFPICWRFFVRKNNIDVLKGHLEFKNYESSGRLAQVMSVEEIFDAIKGKMP